MRGIPFCLFATLAGCQCFVPVSQRGDAGSTDAGAHADASPCTPVSDSALCASLGKDCGVITAQDNCGNTRTASCGACASPMNCGGGGIDNVCGCPGGCVRDAGRPDAGVPDGGHPDGASLTDSGSGPDGGPGDAGVSDSGSTFDAGITPCTLTVSPSALYFGSVTANLPLTKYVTLKDFGSLACQVSGVALAASSDPGFSLANPAMTSFQVNPGTSARIGVTYTTPTVAPPLRRTGSLSFQTTDTNNASDTVPVSAFLSNSVYASGWPKWHFDNRNSGQSEADTSWLQGTVAWTFNIGSQDGGTPFINSPVVDAQGNVYQLGMDGSFYAVSPTGSQLWKTVVAAPGGDTHPSTPNLLANGNIVLVTNSDGNTGQPSLYLISSAGIVLDQVSYGEDGFDACPLVSNDAILFEADDDGPAVTGGSGDPFSALAFQISATSSTQLAGLSLPLTNESERFGIAVADDDTTYWANNGQFFALTAPSAGFKQLSAWPSAGVNVGNAGGFSEIISDLAVDGRINNYIFAYSAWESIDPTTFNTTIVGAVAAINPANGAVAWTTNLPAVSLGNISFGVADYGNAAPAVADDGTVYVGHGDGLRALDGATGNQQWLFRTADVTSSPAIGGDGTVFFGVKDGTFYALNPDGTLRFKLTAGAQVSSSPAIAGDGTVYFVSDDANLYAVH